MRSPSEVVLYRVAENPAPLSDRFHDEILGMHQKCDQPMFANGLLYLLVADTQRLSKLE
jgi:hypothetical protein